MVVVAFESFQGQLATEVVCLERQAGLTEIASATFSVNHFNSEGAFNRVLRVESTEQHQNLPATPTYKAKVLKMAEAARAQITKGALK